MKKLFSIALVAIPFLAKAPDPFPHLSINQKKQRPITNAMVHSNHKMMFKKEFRWFDPIYRDFKKDIDDFYAEVKRYASSALENQKQYANFKLLVDRLHQIKQKKLTIIITKLLQYKKGARGTEELAHVDKHLADLKKYIEEIENILKAVEIKNELLKSYFTSEELSREIPVAQHFKNILSEGFFFKIKKIKRSITNWYSKIFIQQQ